VASAARPQTASYDAFWWLWWLDNHPRFLHPHRFDSTTTGGRYGDLVERSRFDGLHAQMGEAIRAQLASGNGEVRARAAIALGRLGGATAVPDLKRLLADASREVRDAAILALGATGSEQAVEPLFDLADDGRLGEARERVSPLAQPLALIALGVGRRLGMGRTVDLRVQRLLAERGDDADPDFLLGGLFYKSLTDAGNLDLRAASLAGDGKARFDVRCRALEELGRTFAQESLATLTAELGGNDLERRRSAAFGLRNLPDDVALAPLLAAFEKERESTTRSLILLAIGERGGADARPFLQGVLADGPRPQRAWAAIALAICTRSEPEKARVEVGALIRKAFASEKSASLQGAYLIAGGIVQDASLVPWMREALASSDSSLRVAASYGLAMIAGDAAREALIARLADEPTSLGKAALAEALGYIADPHDAEHLVAVFHAVSDPALRGTVARAMGLHGSPQSFEFLRTQLAQAESAPVRAGVLEALGLILGKNPAFVLSELVQGSNPGAFPYWLRDVTDRTL
jgi:HEAT repeat protein